MSTDSGGQPLCVATVISASRPQLPEAVAKVCTSKRGSFNVGGYAASMPFAQSFPQEPHIAQLPRLRCRGLDRFHVQAKRLVLTELVPVLDHCKTLDDFLWRTSYILSLRPIYVMAYLANLALAYGCGFLI